MGDFQLCRQLPTQLIEHADLLLAVCDIQSHLTGSVGAAILSAQNRSIPVTMICPDTAEISHSKDGAPNPEIV